MVPSMTHQVAIATVVVLFMVIASTTAAGNEARTTVSFYMLLSPRLRAFNIKTVPKLKPELDFGRVVGGADAAPQEFPSAARIAYKVNGQTACTGSIVAREWILTAGHCMVEQSGPVRDLTQFKVIVGEHHIDQKEENEQVLQIKKANVHEKYFVAKDQFRYDIALLQVTPAIRYGKTVVPSNLAPCKDYEPGEVVKVRRGADFYQHGKPPKFPKVLKKLKTQTVSDADCKNSTDAFDIPSHCICSFQNGEAACFGDSGGPV